MRAPTRRRCDVDPETAVNIELGTKWDCRRSPGADRRACSATSARTTRSPTRAIPPTRRRAAARRRSARRRRRARRGRPDHARLVDLRELHATWTAKCCRACPTPASPTRAPALRQHRRRARPARGRRSAARRNTRAACGPPTTSTTGPSATASPTRASYRLLLGTAARNLRRRSSGYTTHRAMVAYDVNDRLACSSTSTTCSTRSTTPACATTAGRPRAMRARRC